MQRSVKGSCCSIIIDEENNVMRGHFHDSIYLIFLAVDETTTDIICIKCKKDNSDSPNEIVLCDHVWYR